MVEIIEYRPLSLTEILSVYMDFHEEPVFNTAKYSLPRNQVQ
jgi:hypothetical protein